MIGLIVASVNIAVIVNGIFMREYDCLFREPLLHADNFPSRISVDPIGSSLACGFMYLTGLLPTGYRLDIFLLAILSSTVNANARFLLGKDNIKGGLISRLYCKEDCYFSSYSISIILKRPDVRSYVWGLYVTNGIAFIANLSMLVPYFLKETSGLPANHSTVY